jgi:flagellar hook assembly protein FlgD
LQLRPGYPNPFNAETTIKYVLPAAGPVQLAVYDVHGQRVRMLADGHYGAGLHRVPWDGRDEDGRPAASGVYLDRVRADDRIQTRKLLLLK